MDKLSMCRICLVEDVKMYSLISANLQALYERLTKIPFETKNKKPVQVCYLCCARLQNCHRLQAACLKSEEFFNKVIADSELNEIELQDLNTLKTVHPLILISCKPSTRKDPEDDKIDEDNDFKLDSLEIASNVQVKHELFEDESYTDEEVHIKSEVTVDEEDICVKYGVISDNRHTMQNKELEHDIQLKTAKVVLERIDLESFKIGRFAAKKPKLNLPNGDTESTESTQPQTEVTVAQNDNIEKKIESPAIEENKNIVKQISFIEKHIKKKICVRKQYVCYLQKHNSIYTGEKPYRCNMCEKSFTRKSNLVNHTRRHTSERPYRCNICGQSFIQKYLLVGHMSMHTDERPYKCDICEKSYSRKSPLIRHIHTHIKRPWNVVM